LSKRTVFVVSDRTGITAEILSHSLLTQFPDVIFHTKALPFVDTPEKVAEAVRQINEANDIDTARPLVFATFVSQQLFESIQCAHGFFVDLFGTFLTPLEQELQSKSSHEIGHSYGVIDQDRYTSRISAVHYAMDCDDGVSIDDYNKADLIILGVSRTGKTPVCLYLAIHFGLFCANYPLTEEDFSDGVLPAILQPFRGQLFGLTIDSNRLCQIRSERRPDSRYSSRQQCEYELAQAQAIFRRQAIPFADTTQMSIEEIGTTILQKMEMRRELLG
jgi:regulator of PEP synthase PpsR (kinase-PPPase family)